jgi:hypothetical protein
VLCDHLQHVDFYASFGGAFLQQAEGSNNIHINYKICEIPSETLTIEGTKVVGYGIVFIDSVLTESTITLPTPIQDPLTTIVTNSNAEWSLIGHTNLQIHGDLIQPNSKIIANGTSQADALLVVDFTSGTCTTGYTIELDEDTIFINGLEAVKFGDAFKDIQFIMSACDDNVYIKSTKMDASSIEIIGTSGTNTIELGYASAPFEDQIHCNVIIDGGKGTKDQLKIHDSSSSLLKDIELRPTLISGIHSSNNNTISMFSIELIDIELGTSPANFTIYSTSKDTSVILASQSSNDIFTIENGKPIGYELSCSWCSTLILISHH